METYIKASVGILITVILCLVLSKEKKEFTTILVIIVCAMVAFIAMEYLQKVISFIYTLESMGNLNSELIKTLLKSVGIGILTQITTMICADSGHAALGKVLQMLSSAVILWLCIPLFTQLLELIEEIMGAV